MPFAYQTADTAQSIGQPDSPLPCVTPLYIAVPSPEMIHRSGDHKRINYSRNLDWLRKMMGYTIARLGQPSPSHSHFVLPVKQCQGNGVFDGIDALTLHGLINTAQACWISAEHGVSIPGFEKVSPYHAADAFDTAITTMRREVRHLIEVPDSDPLPSDLGLVSCAEKEAFEDIALYGGADNLGQNGQPLREIFRELGLALYYQSDESFELPGDNVEIAPLCINQHADSPLKMSGTCPLQGDAPDGMNDLTDSERSALEGMARLAGKSLTVEARYETTRTDAPGSRF